MTSGVAAGLPLLKMCFERFLDPPKHAAVVFLGTSQDVPLVHVEDQALNRRVDTPSQFAGTQSLDLNRAVRVQSLTEALFPEALDVAVRRVGLMLHQAPAAAVVRRHGDLLKVQVYAVAAVPLDDGAGDGAAARIPVADDSPGRPACAAGVSADQGRSGAP